MTTSLQHRLSVVARAFKAHALAAVTVRSEAAVRAGHVETFRRVDPRSLRKGSVDLPTAS